jgi:hypothetical protein
MLKARLPIQTAVALRRISSISGSATRLLGTQHLRPTGHASANPLRGYFRPLATAVQSVLNGNSHHQFPPSMTVPTEGFDTNNFELLQRVKVDYADIEVGLLSGLDVTAAQV